MIKGLEKQQRIPEPKFSLIKNYILSAADFFLSDKKQTTQLFLILNAYILFLTNNLVNKTFPIKIFNLKQIEKSILIFSFVFVYKMKYLDFFS